MSSPPPGPEPTLPIGGEARAFVTGAVAAVRRIATPEGIERSELVDVGDDRQWISIRGRHRDNPVLLVIHGGPGTPTMPLAWAFQSPWEDFFTVVHWDQRGVGRNAPGADHAVLSTTASLARLLDDGEAVIEHLCRALGKARIALLGFSWGALLGVLLAERLPSRVSVYAGTGQAISPAFEPMLLALTRDAAQRAGDDEGLRELAGLDVSPQPDGSLPLPAIQVLRRVARRHGGMWRGHETLQPMLDAAVLSPEYGDADVAAFRAGSAWLGTSPLMRDIAACDLRRVTSLQVPVVLLQGRLDLATPHDAAAAWLDALHAPSKELVSFERSAHFAMLEEPGRFLLALLQHVLPHTEGPASF